MYVITFYSFKGGVGRTMAMVNAAAQLVKHGRRVLLVDFDLEAPGLDAFPLLRPAKPSPGIVEYVTEYLNTGRAPLATDFAFSCSGFGEVPGQLSIMPSGLRDHTYSSRLQAINWLSLYSDHDGYLLFEDLKAQWETHLGPDYVLVDSRTGHTDVGGICTRQLPNAVVLCFLPNEENIRGLESIVSEIRREGEGPLRKHIETLFVPSNVPNLDDEEDILNRRLEEAERRLGFAKPDATIYRYDHLSLLDSEIFAISHPRSKLAKECDELARAMTAKNFEDRHAALRLLSDDEAIVDHALFGESRLDLALERIRTAHAGDGEVIHKLGVFKRQLGRGEEATKLFDDAARLGYRSVEMMIDSARRLAEEGNLTSALVALKEALDDSRATFPELNRATRLAAQLDTSALADFMGSPRFKSLQPYVQASLCDEMFVTRNTLAVVERTLRTLCRGQATSALRTTLMLSLMGQQKFEEAMAVLGGAQSDLSLMYLPEVFNFAVAKWGASKRVPVDCFRRVIDLVPSSRAGHSKNTRLCFAIAHWATGNLDAAHEFLAASEKMARLDESESFSCWRYLKVTPEQFCSDLPAVRSMIEGADVLPAVFE